MLGRCTNHSECAHGNINSSMEWRGATNFSSGLSTTINYILFFFFFKIANKHLIIGKKDYVSIWMCFETIKIIPLKIHTLTNHQIEELKSGSFPPLQSQRRNSTFLVLTYIIEHIDGILKLFSEVKNQISNYFSSCSFKKNLGRNVYLQQYMNIDKSNQDKVYLTFRWIENTLKLIGTTRAL